MISTLKEVRDALKYAWGCIENISPEEEAKIDPAITKLDALIAAQEKAEPVAQIGTTEQAARFLNASMKPDVISGNERNQRLKELLSWFSRLIDGQANPKWLREHAYELAYTVAIMSPPQPAPSTSPLTWQPIETAPKPSGRVLLSADGETCYGHWYSTYNRWEYDGYEWGNPKNQPTHWMPLPAPPFNKIGAKP